MSSQYVRDQITDFIEANAPTENLIDLTAQYQELPDLISDEGLTASDPWLGLEFIADDEIPITVPATNTQGKYRETGAVYLHVVGIAKLGVASSILARGETLRNLFRGRRIGNVIIDSVTPLSFGAGTTLNFEGGYTSGSFIASYQNDLDL